MDKVVLTFRTAFDKAVKSDDWWPVVDVSSDQWQSWEMPDPGSFLWLNFTLDHMDGHHSLHEYLWLKHRPTEAAQLGDTAYLWERVFLIMVQMNLTSKYWIVVRNLNKTNLCIDYHTCGLVNLLAVSLRNMKIPGDQVSWHFQKPHKFSKCSSKIKSCSWRFSMGNSAAAAKGQWGDLILHKTWSNILIHNLWSPLISF